MLATSMLMSPVVYIRTQRAGRDKQARYSNLANHPSNLANHLSNIANHPSNLANHPSNLANHPPN